jgi:hypothetical protein
MPEAAGFRSPAPVGTATVECATEGHYSQVFPP